MLIASHVYFVTGGASGLGLATVHLLHAQGAFVAILDLNPAAGAALVQKLGSERAVFVKCDVKEEKDVKEAIRIVDEKWGKDAKVGGTVHCAGIAAVGKTVGANGEPFDLAAFKGIIDINLTGSFNVARLVAARIIRTTKPPTNPKTTALAHVKGDAVVDDQQDRGVIILVTSKSFEEGQMGQVAYASSKAGVVGLVLPMARDLARHGIRVVAIAPSLFSTAMGASTGEKVRAHLLEDTLFPARFGEAEEFAHCAKMIIENQMLNASTIRLDGGGRMSKF